MEDKLLQGFAMHEKLQENKLTYEAPALTVVTFRAERGFAASWEATNQKLKELDEDLQAQLDAGGSYYGQPAAAYLEDGGYDYIGNGSTSATGWQTSTGSWF